MIYRSFISLCFCVCACIRYSICICVDDVNVMYENNFSLFVHCSASLSAAARRANFYPALSVQTLKMKSILLVAAVAATVVAVVLAGVGEHDDTAPHTLRSAFLEWAEEHGKEYDSEAEFNARFAIWREQKSWIDQHNKRTGMCLSPSLSL